MLNTQQIMTTALRLAHFQKVPADSEVHVKGRNLKRILVAIDVGVGELLLAKELGCDGVIAHHPAGGRAVLDGYRVFMRHVGQMVDAGVPRKVAEEAVKNKFRTLDIQHHPENYDQVPNAAKKLGLALMSVHSPCDEIGRQTLVEAVADLGTNAPLRTLISRMDSFPEFRNAQTRIRTRIGSLRNRTGKLAISHACYTNGGFEVAKAYFQNGIDTLCYIHISEPDLTRLAAEKLVGNLVILGHIASDWLGINCLLRELEKKDVEFVPTSDLAV